MLKWFGVDVGAGPYKKSPDGPEIEQNNNPSNTPPHGDQNGPSGSPSQIHATAFLLNNVSKKCSFRLMDAQNDENTKREIINYLASQNYTVAYVCSTIWGDDMGNVRSRFIYMHERRDWWRQWLAECNKAGLRVIMWIRSDDSPEQNKWSEQKFNEHCKLVVDDLGDLISEYCLGIECNEWGWGKERCHRHVKYIKQISGKPVGVHTGSIEGMGYADGADVYYLQYGFNKSLSLIESETKQAKSKFKGRVIAAEYHRSGETDEAKRMGDAAIMAGADGVGCGCGANGLKILIDRLGKTDTEPKPSSGPRLISVTAAEGKHVLIRTSGCDKWPLSKSGDVQAKLYVRDGRGKRVMVDFLRPEQLIRGIRKTIKNAFGKDEHSIDVARGETIQFWASRLDDKESTNEFDFVWPWETT